MPQANVTIYQKGAYYLGVKIFNNLLLEIKNIAGNLKNIWNCSETVFVHLLYTLDQPRGLVVRVSDY